MAIVSNLEWSFEPPGSALNYTPIFGNNYYNNVFLPMCQVYSLGAIANLGVKFIPASQWTGQQMEAYLRW